MRYPGRVVKVGDTDRAVVAAIARALAAHGQAAWAGREFDRALASAVKLFQSQNLDALGRPLRIDGQVGPLTWAALFDAPAAAAPAPGLGNAALVVAIGEVGVLEDPPASNRGPRVDQYLASVGLAPGNFWCMAFVHFCFDEAVRTAGTPNPFPRTGGCLVAWNTVRRDSPSRVLVRDEAIAKPSRVQPGMVFIHDYGSGRGHTGFVREVVGGGLRTVEGNADPEGGRNGLGVFALNRRSVTDRSLKGFLRF